MTNAHFRQLSLLCLAAISIHYAALAADAPLRRPISNTNPMFVFNCYDNTAQGLENQFNAIPVDLRPYSVIVCQFYIGTGDDAPHAEYVAKVEELATRADQIGAWLLYWNAAGDRREDFTSAEIDRFFLHPRFLGLGYVETTTGAFCNGAAGYPWSSVAKDLSACARNGGIIFWQDYTFSEFCEQRNKSFWTELPKSLIDSFRVHRDNVVLDDKHNSYGGGDYVNTGCIFGYWLSDLAGTWGYHTEDWDWQSHNVPGYGVFGSDEVPIDAPKAGFGTDFMHVIPMGCCVYSGESPGNVYPGNYGRTVNDIRLNPPAWKMVLYPLWQRMLRDTLIPGKQDVLARAMVAVQASAASPSQFALNGIYKGLYGPNEASGLWEWWPSTGRYGIVPILAPPVGASETSRFPEVVHTASLPWSTQAEKTAWFNARYSEEPGALGNSWFYNVGNKWFVTNPHEDGRDNTTFRFNLSEPPSLSLGGDLTKFAFAIAKETRGSLNIYINNYLLNQNADTASENQFIRKNVMRVTGLSSEPSMTLTAVKGYHGNNNFSYTQAWDAAGKVFTVTLNHNGPVDFTVNHADFQGPDAATARVVPRRAPSYPSSIVNLVTIAGRIARSGISLHEVGACGTFQWSVRYGAGVYLVQEKGAAGIGAKTVLDERRQQR